MFSVRIGVKSLRLIILLFKEREFQGVLESVDVGSSFIVLGLTELQYSTRNPSLSADWLEVN